ncbi:hypothetical protein [Bradyrhizobium sp. AC87j1]|nr:hypothetical protein [Bradyrhizobium sp. AC87j1]
MANLSLAEQIERSYDLAMVALASTVKTSRPTKRHPVAVFP